MNDKEKAQEREKNEAKRLRAYRDMGNVLGWESTLHELYAASKANSIQALVAGNTDAYIHLNGKAEGIEELIEKIRLVTRQQAKSEVENVR